MAMEYLYWCIVTNMGILADAQTCAGIADEWEPCTPELFESTDTLMFNLVTNPENKLPQLAPDGNYCPANAGIKKQTNPMSFSILSTYPNPFNPTTTIQFSVSTMTIASLGIYDISGRLVETLVRGDFEAGEHEVIWNAVNHSSGIYFVRLESNKFIETQKIVLVK